MNNYDTRMINNYYKTIRKYPLLTADQEIELAKKIKEGDKKSLNLLVNSNLRFVVSVARCYEGQGLTLRDLIQEGNSGLIKAATRFNDGKNVRFISYAVWWIRQGITFALIDTSRTVRIPGNQISYAKKRSKIVDGSKKPDIPYNYIDDYITSMVFNEPYSLDTPIDQRNKVVLGDILTDPSQQIDENALDKQQMRKTIDVLLKDLDERERFVVTKYFGYEGKNGDDREYTLQELGDELNLSRERVRQLKNVALKKTKKNAIRNGLKKDMLQLAP